MNIKKYIIASGFIFALAGCNDDFMERYPLTKPVDANFWTSESDMKLYLNGLYPIYIIGHGSSWSDSKFCPPTTVVGSPIAYGDAFSDNVLRSANNEFIEMAGMNKIPTGSGSKDNAWYWEDLRRVNYFLAHYQKAQVSDAIKAKYAGEAYFFKAIEYFKKVKTFGDVPWITKDLNVDSEELQGPRTPRAEVMDSVLMCLNKAVDGLPASPETGRVGKDQANFLKARVCLFEGTFRKYHGLQGYDKFLQECKTACEAVINTGKYDLYTGDGADSYYTLFTKTGLNAYSGNKEVVLGRLMIPDLLGNAFQRYYDQNNSNRVAMGASKSLVDEYLCEDGLPIGEYSTDANGKPQITGGSSLFKGYGMWDELENRDPRMTKTICRPGEYITISMSGGAAPNPANGISYPNPRYTGSGNTVSGWRFIKHWMGSKEECDLTTKGLQAAIEYRYAELLLNYAEVLYELNGTLTQAEADMTINKLRERAGFDFVTYPTAKLDVSNVIADPRLDRIYADKLGYTVSPLLREIRRERRVELALENHRYEDLLRWKAGKLFTVPSRGTRFDYRMVALYDGSHTERPIEGVAPEMRIGTDIFLDADSFLIAYPRSPYRNTINGVLPWEDYRYLWPIPAEEIRRNPNLKQNPGWEEAEANK